MEQRQRVRKALALVSAVGLVGAFVLYSGGTGFMAGSKSNPAFKTVETVRPPAPAPQDPPKPASGADWTFTVTPGDKTAEPNATPVPVKPGE